MPTMKAAVYFLSFCLILISLNADASKEKRHVKKLSKQNWTQVQTKNFLITSDAKLEKVESIAVQLEEFRYFVSKYMGLSQVDGLPPIRFLVLENSDTYDLLGLDDRIAGVFSDKISGFVSIANGDDFSISQRKTSFGKATIMHEMVHYFNHNQIKDIHYPFWYEEGVAEYLSTMTKFDGKITFGNMHALRNRFLEMLRRTGKCCWSVDVESLLKYKKNSEGERPKALYARSFILVHYLNTSKQKRQQMTRYLALVNTGMSVDDAFAQSFDISFDELTEQVDDYLANRKVFGRVFPVGKGGLEFPTFETQVRQLSSEEGVFQALDISMQFPHSKNGELDVAKTIQGFSEVFPDSHLHLLLNSLYHSKTIVSQKFKDLNAFLKVYPNHSRALTKFGSLYVLLASKTRARGQERWKQHNAKARDYLLKAIEADPINSLAYYELAKTYEYTPYSDANIEQAIYGLEVVRLFNEDYQVHKREGLLRLSVGDYLKAESSFSRLVALSDSRWTSGYATWVRDGLKVLKLQTLEKTIAEGTLTYSDGSLYTGSVESSAPHGQGLVILPNGTKYDGQWLNGIPHGQGRLVASNGIVYQGEFYKGGVHGHGTIDYAGLNGDIVKYEGEFFRFVEHGKGQHLEPGQIVIKGSRFKGMLDGTQHFIKQDGSSANIPFFLGRVMYTEPDGTIFSGKIDRSSFKPTGKGKCRAEQEKYFKRCVR